MRTRDIELKYKIRKKKKKKKKRKQESLAWAETQNTENENITEPKAIKSMLTPADRIKLSLIKKSMTEMKTLLVSLRS